MIPMFGFFTKMTAISASTQPEDMYLVMQDMYGKIALWNLILSPIYAIFHGVYIAYVQSLWTLSYIRLSGVESLADEKV